MRSGWAVGGEWGDSGRWRLLVGHFDWLRESRFPQRRIEGLNRSGGLDDLDAGNSVFVGSDQDRI